MNDRDEAGGHAARISSDSSSSAGPDALFSGGDKRDEPENGMNKCTSELETREGIVISTEQNMKNRCQWKDRNSICDTFQSRISSEEGQQSGQKTSLGKSSATSG